MATGGRAIGGADMLRTVPQGARLARPRARSLHWRDPAMPELPDVTVYLEALRRAHRRRAARAHPARQPLRAALGRSATRRGGGPRGDRRPAPGQAHRDRARGRALRAHPPDDRGPAALEGRPARSCPARSGWPRSTSRPARSPSPRRDRSAAPPSTWCAARPRSPRTIRAASSSGRRRRRLPGRAHPRVPHAQADADRPAHPERHRQRLLRRDPAPGPALAGAHDAPALRGGERAALRGGEGHARRLDRAAAAARRRASSRRA